MRVPSGEPPTTGCATPTRAPNGFLKDPAHEALDDAGRRRVHGVAAQSLLVAFLILAANLRKIRSFLEKVAVTSGTLKRLPRSRRTRPLGDSSPTVASPDPGSSPDPRVYRLTRSPSASGRAGN
jgi:hypothetical protein